MIGAREKDIKKGTITKVYFDLLPRYFVRR
jgi:hypothetical protein